MSVSFGWGCLGFVMLKILQKWRYGNLTACGNGRRAALLYNCLTKKCVLYFGYGKTIEPKAALPLLYFAEGSSSPPNERKEGDAMITYQDFFLFCTFIVALISLLYQIFKDKRK